MSIRITVKQTHLRGRKGYEVKRIEGVIRHNKLPYAYIENYHKIVGRLQGGPNAKEVIEYERCEFLKEQCFYAEEDFLEKIEVVKKAGRLLHEINARVKEEQKTWNKEETFVI